MLITTHTADVYRLTQSSSKDNYGAAPIVQDVEVAIFPADTELLMLFPASTTYAQFQVFTEDMREYKTGDKFKTSDGREIILRHVAERFPFNLGVNFQWFIGEEVP